MEQDYEDSITNREDIKKYIDNITSQFTDINRSSKTIIFDCKKIINYDTFYDEVQRKLTNNCEWFGRNLDAFYDVLYGGFGIFEHDEIVNILMINIRTMIENMGTHSLFIKMLGVMISCPVVFEIIADDYCLKYIEILKNNIKQIWIDDIRHISLRLYENDIL